MGEESPVLSSSLPASSSSSLAAPPTAATPALLQEGLLSRLDDKLDELEAAHRLSRPQLQEEDYVAVRAGAAPTQPGPQRRQRLADAVKDLTCQWSEGFQALASEGDAACMFIVAQMYLAPRGYGSVTPDRAKGLSWLWRSIDAGDLEARAYARRAAHKDLMEHLARKHILEQQAQQGGAADAIEEDALRIAMEQMSVKEKEVEKEEKRVVAEREAEFGE